MGGGCNSARDALFARHSDRWQRQAMSIQLREDAVDGATGADLSAGLVSSGDHTHAGEVTQTQNNVVSDRGLAPGME